MVTTIRNLPDELLVDTLGKLLKKDLKSARLVCTLWSTAGAKWMFERVYFAPRKTSMKLFTDIAANLAFAPNVKELIYDGRLFLSELGTFGSYYSAFGARVEEEFDLFMNHVKNLSDVSENHFAGDVYEDSIWNGGSLGANEEMKTANMGHLEDFHANAGDSLVRYARLLQQQESIFTKAKDLKALREGLRSFRNITKVSVVVDFRHHSDYEIYADDRHFQYIEHHQWYSSRSYTEFGFAVPPSKWCPDSRSQYGEHLSWDDSKWDVRGVHNLFRAISTHCPRLKELRIGSTQYKAPMTIFNLFDNGTEKYAAMVRDLTKLRLYPYVAKGDNGARQYRCLGRFLQEAKELRILSSSRWASDFEGWDEAADNDAALVWNLRIDFGFLLGKQWPRLTKLTLKQAWVKAGDLMQILRAHTQSLRELHLMDIYLHGNESWEHLGTEIGKILELYSVSISRLSDQSWTPDHPWPRGAQGSVLIRNMMQWEHPDKLEIEEKYATFTGRLKASPRQIGE